MTDNLESRIAMQANALVGKARMLANMWQFCEDKGMASFVPPLFAMPGVELPIVPRIAWPRIEGAARQSGRR